MTNRILISARAVFFGFCTLAVACGSGGGGGAPESTESLLTISDDDAFSTSRTDGELETGTAVSSDAGMLDALAVFPAIIELRSSEVTGLMLGLTDSSQLDVELDQLDEVWLDLQDCLGIGAVPPLVVIQAAAVEPLSSDDDALFNFFGQIVASAHDAQEGTSIQLQADELIGQNLNEVFALRSALSRHIWRSNGLSETDFDTSCITVRGS